MIVSLLFVMASTVWNPLATTSRVFRDEVVLDDDPHPLDTGRNMSVSLVALKSRTYLMQSSPIRL